MLLKKKPKIINDIQSFNTLQAHRRQLKMFAEKLSLKAVVGIALIVVAFGATIALEGAHLQKHYAFKGMYTANIDTTLPMPTGLGITTLDSTLRLNWTPSTDGRVAWQYVAAWDGSTIVGSKVVSRTTTAADLNGLQAGHTYNVTVQSMDSDNKLSNPLAGAAAPDLQSPMKDAAFFESFDNTPPGNLPNDYFDVSIETGNTHPSDVPDRAMVFSLEKHFHTETTGATGETEIYLRPTGTFDFTGRTGTFQTEVDLQAIQSSPGKWFEIHLSRKAPAGSLSFGTAQDGTYPDDVSFTLIHPLNSNDPNVYNEASISVNTAETRTLQNDGTYIGKVFTGQVKNISSANVRVPVVLKVSQTSAEMFINGQSVVKATGFTLPFTKGTWSLNHRNFYAHIANLAVEAHQLDHWDMVQFDGQPGSVPLTRKTYQQQGCPVVDTFEFECQSDNPTVTLNVPEDVTQAKEAQLYFRATTDCTTNLSSLSTSFTINGHTGTATSQPTIGRECYNHTEWSTDVPTDWLAKGNNVIKIPRKFVDRVRLEVAYNTPKPITSAPVTPTPILAVTSGNFDIRSVDGTKVTRTTYLFSQGSPAPVNYQVVNSSQETPWLTINTPTTGSIQSIGAGGALVPITFTVDFSKVPPPSDDTGKFVGLLKVTGGVMPIYIGMIAQQDNSYPPLTNGPFTPLITVFNKDAIPYYHGAGSSPGPSPSPTPSPSPSPTPTPTPTPTPSPTPTPTPVPTPPPATNALLGDTTVESGHDTNKAGQAEAFPYTAGNSGTTSKLFVYLDSSNTATQVAVGLYSNTNNRPGTLLAQGTITSPTKGAWNSVSISSVNITKGTRYWIAVLAPSGKGLIQFRDQGSGGVSYTSSQTNLTTLPNTWSNGLSWPSTAMSAYAQ